jgi:phospholipid/cholesterol/gamma-HCH transport system substrate-binding protein
VAFAFLAVKLGGIGDVSAGHYMLKARFQSSSGLKEGADVEVAGVVVGKVLNIRFDPAEYESVVELSIPNDVHLQDDAIASVRSTGLIGGKFVKITPGGSDVILQPGETISETESSVSLEELIGKYIFESQSKSN